MSPEILSSLKPQHDFFVGIDSDGCVFDSMEVKQKEFFIPNALKYFELWPISGLLRKTWESVNLYSINRGGNRFISLIKVFDLLSKNETVKKHRILLPDTNLLKQWVATENKLGNDTLRKFVEKHPDSSLKKILLWSEAVNEDITKWLRNIPPFENVKPAIEKIIKAADLVVISQTPSEAVIREWKENGLDVYTRAIAGQEYGTKSEQLKHAAGGKYDKDKVIMIGDAIGDLNASEANGILFFPIIPGKEEESWKIFINEGLPVFLEGKFLGDFQKNIINEFRRSLPENLIM
ncbi:MAG TPA: HAD hydrolase-like protein [Bacteroidales bacterium]|nr:HAD hydrolase-like protein [Bacteroidales bacterium]